MRLLAAVERFFERAFERSSVRLFRAPLQPVQIERRLERALETAAVARPGGALVPDHYRVAVHPSELAALGVAPAELAGRLADGLLAAARRRGYRLVGSPRVEIVTKASLPKGDVEVEVTFSRPAGPRLAAALPMGAGATPAAEATGLLPRPLQPAPEAQLVVRSPDGRTRTLPLDGRPVTIGRAPDNRLRIDDPRVSRHHARIVLRDGSYVLVDLGSTNGTWVEGLRVSEVVLGAGDRIDIAAGAAELRVETAATRPAPERSGP